MHFLLWRLLPILLSMVAGYFGISKVLGILDKASRTETAEQALVVQDTKHKAELAKIEATLKKVQANAAETEQRREHWRKSYYNTKRKYDEYTKKWGPNSYPAELD